jgi:membrane protease YdiL (CAAX protease family)
MTNLKPLLWVSALRIFACFSLLLLIVTRLLIPRLAAWSGQETILMWFLAAGLGVFAPLLVTALGMIRKEGLGLNSQTWRDRLRFKALSRRDLGWSLGGLLLIGLLTALLMKGLEFCLGSFNHTPSFMSFEPLSTGRYWLLAVWFPFWLLNIMGEEILWRGVLLPRQEIASGRSAWLIHGLGWGLFHLAFGWQLGLSLIPILFILPWVVQKTGNSWTGVIIHAGLNGPGFVAIALGLI